MMKSKVWLSFSLILVLSGIGFSQTTKKTITNLDLEKYKQQREKSEADYRAKYKELGMPSPEELEQRNAEDKRQREELSQRLSLENQQNQNNWQTQANYLRTQIISVDAQINYLNGQIAGLPNQNQIFFSPNQVNAITYIPFGYGGQRASLPRTVVRPIDNVQTVTNASAANPNPFYGTPLYSSGIKLVIGQTNQGRRGHGRNYGNGGYYAPFTTNNNYSVQRDELISRLQYLGQVKAGLLAQWNNLVNDAHRAGIRINF
jgi:hypothetical protein